MEITNIVCSRYNRNTDFVYRINNGENIKVMVYDKENNDNPYNVPVNKGNEASVYLKYIIDHYDNLSEFTYFIHDEEYSWHHSGSIIDKFKEAKDSKEKYYNINHFEWKEALRRDHYEEYLKFYNEIIEEYIPLKKVPNGEIDLRLGYKGCAQFLVHRDLIRCLPKEFYIKLYNWIMTTNLPSKDCGFYLEYSWHVFWVIYPKILQEK